MSNVLETIQTGVKAILSSDSYYSKISLVTEQAGDIATMIQTAIGKLGLCIIIATPKATCAHPNAPGPMLDPLDLSIDIVEMVIKNRGANGSRLPASEVAEHTAWLLHWPNHAHHRTDAYPLTVRKFYTVPDDHFQIYRVELTTSGALAGIIA